MQLMTAGEVAVQLSASPSTESSHCAGRAVPCHFGARTEACAVSCQPPRSPNEGNKLPTRRLDAERRFTETAGDALKKRATARLPLHLKHTNCDGYPKRRAWQLQRLVLRAVAIFTDSRRHHRAFDEQTQATP